MLEWRCVRWHDWVLESFYLCGWLVLGDSGCLQSSGSLVGTAWPYILQTPCLRPSVTADHVHTCLHVLVPPKRAFACPARLKGALRMCLRTQRTEHGDAYWSWRRKLAILLGWALTWKHLWQQLLAGERSRTAPGEGKSRDGPERMGVADVGLSSEELHAKFGFWKPPTVPVLSPHVCLRQGLHGLLVWGGVLLWRLGGF